MKRATCKLGFAIAAALCLGFASVAQALTSPINVNITYTPATPGWGVSAFTNVQEGVNACSPGGTVNIAAGIYTNMTGVTITNAGITVTGVGTDPLTGTIVRGNNLANSLLFILQAGGTTPTNRLVIQNMLVKGHSTAFDVTDQHIGYITLNNVEQTNSVGLAQSCEFLGVRTTSNFLTQGRSDVVPCVVTDLVMTNCIARDFHSYGININGDCSMLGWKIANCTFIETYGVSTLGEKMGIYTYPTVSSNSPVATISNFFIVNTVFSNIHQRATYLSKNMTDMTVSNCFFYDLGYAHKFGSETALGITPQGGQGNVTIVDSRFEDCGIVDLTGSAISMGYSEYDTNAFYQPPVMGSNVVIRNVMFTNCETAIMFKYSGAPKPINAHVNQCLFQSKVGRGMQSAYTNGTMIEARSNWWNAVDGPGPMVGYTTPIGSGDGINYGGGNVYYSPWLGDGFNNDPSKRGFYPNLTPIYYRATQMAFQTQPGNSAWGVLSTQPVVEVRNEIGGVASQFNGTVTMAIFNNPSGGTLGGNMTPTAVNGVAVFTNLSIDALGDGYTLQASGLVFTRESAAFNVMAADQVIADFMPTNGSVFEVADTPGLSATGGGSTNPVVFAVAAGPGTISGLTNLAFSVPGIVDVTASQDGDTNFYAAATVTNTYTAMGSQTIAFPTIPAQVATSTVTLAATASSGLAVAFAVASGPATITDGVLSFTGDGSVGIVASQAGSAIWHAAPDVTNTLIVTKADQEITFPAIPDQDSSASVTLSATASSGLPVAFAVVSGPATINAGVMTFSGAGTVSVSADQAGDALYNAAGQQVNTFDVKTGQTITFAAIPDKVVTDTVTLSATASSGLAVTFAVGSGPATISGGVLSFTGPGSVSVIASQAGDATWLAAPDVTRTFNVAKADQTITFAAIPDQVVTSTVTLSATASSGLAVTFAVGSGPATISGGVLSFTGTGSVTIDASQAGDANWNAATPVQNTFNVTGAGGGGVSVISDADFDGDMKMDLALYDQAAGLLYAKLSTTGYALVTVPIGGAGSESAMADYDGDGKTDPAAYDAATGMWQIQLSASGYTPVSMALGGPGYEAVQGDYDGDGKADPAIYKTADGTWSVAMSSMGYTLGGVTGLGGAGFLPVQQRYDSDTRIDAAIYNTANGNWTVLLSASAYVTGTLWGFGGTGFAPVSGDFDGDGLDDPAIYEEATTTWQVKLSASGYSTASLTGFGGAGTSVAAGDYDGDGKADLCYLDLATGVWHVKLSASGYSEATLPSGYTP